MLLKGYFSIRIVLHFMKIITIFISHRIRSYYIQPNDALYYGPVLCELRVLKICSVSLNLRRTINIYWDSLVKMRDLLLYIVLTMFVVAVLSLTIYQGSLSQRCVPKNFVGPGEITSILFVNFFSVITFCNEYVLVFHFSLTIQYLKM